MSVTVDTEVPSVKKIGVKQEIPKSCIELEVQELKAKLAEVEKAKDQACIKLQEVYIQVEKYYKKNSMFEIRTQNIIGCIKLNCSPM